MATTPAARSRWMSASWGARSVFKAPPQERTDTRNWTACRSGVVCSPLVSPDTRKSPPQTTLAEILRYSQRAALPNELGAGGPLVHAVSGTPIRCLRAPLGAGRNSKQEAILLQVCFDPSRREHTTRCGAGSFIAASCSPSGTSHERVRLGAYNLLRDILRHGFADRPSSWRVVMRYFAA